MIFADDIVLIAEYEVVHQEIDIRIGDRILQPKESFRYLGSVIHRSGRIDDNVAHRIRAWWMKWRVASGVLYDWRIPLKLKGKFYKVAIRPTTLYGSECWPITKAQATRVEVAELRMLRWICGKTMIDMIPNGVFRAAIDVDSIVDKMKEGRLRWFGHVKMRPQNASVRRVEAMKVKGSSEGHQSLCTRTLAGGPLEAVSLLSGYPGRAHVKMRTLDCCDTQPDVPTLTCAKTLM
nr:putative reverse transcriptase, identical [Tanacetum cinerariifolium]